MTIIVKARFFFCLALLLSDALIGCRTETQEFNTPLYLYFGYEAYGSAQRYLSTRIQPGNEIRVGGDDYWELTGKVDRRGSNFVANVSGGNGQEEQFYQGQITTEKPFFPQGGAASGGVSLFWFIVSTNSDCPKVLERVNAKLDLTNTPFNHPISIPPLPVLNKRSNVPPGDIDPMTGLPKAHEPPPLDPKTGLPLPSR